MPTKKQQILDLLAETGVLRPRDLEEIGISGVYLNKLHAEGVLDRPSRGLYIFIVRHAFSTFWITGRRRSVSLRKSFEISANSPSWKMDFDSTRIPFERSRSKKTKNTRACE